MEFLKDFWMFLKERKKFWLIPMIIVLVLIGALLVFGTTGAAAPFIYTLFQMIMKGMDKYKVLETMATLALALIVLQFVFAGKLAISENVHDYLFLWIAAGFLAIALFSTAIVGLIFICINIYFKEDFNNWYCALVGLALLLSSALPFKLSELISFSWLKLGEGMGFVMSKVILGAVFFLFVSPLSFLFRIFNRKHMQLNKGGDSYYITRNKTFEKKDLGNTW